MRIKDIDMTKVYKLVITSLIVLLLISCQKKSKTEIDLFFTDFSKIIALDDLERFETSKLDSAGTTIELLYEEMDTIMKNLDSDSKLFKVLQSTGVPRSSYFDAKYFLIAFHLYLHERRINYSNMRFELNKLYRYKEEQENKAIRAENLKLVEMNDTLFKVGDTINVDLPIDTILGFISTIYYTGIVPDSVFLNLHETLNLTGIITQKKYGGKTLDYGLTFGLKVLNMTRYDIPINSIETKLGDTVILDVYSYYRLIRPGWGKKN